MHVFTIPASAPFLRTLIGALVDGRIIEGFEARSRPERLAEATLYLPTRRAGRMARDVFLDVLGLDAAILPRIVTLGAIDDDASAFADTEIREWFDIPEAIGPFERRLILARLIEQWAKAIAPGDATQTPLVLSGPASTLALAGDLARLMDDMATRGVDWAALDTLPPAELDRYWNLTLRFLKIAREAWPAVLAERGRIEPALRRDALIDAEAARLTAAGGPVIAAGSTGSMPATAKFLHAIARLPQGAVVLPGLDTDLDDDAWASIGGSAHDAPASNHPQFAMHGLLARFGLRRGDVRPLGAVSMMGRDVLASEAMRPARATGAWQRRLAMPDVAQKIASGIAGLAVVEADNAEMESLAIAVAMREACERDGTTALVTPDRALARRVAAALGRWGLKVDDSAGDALTDTPAGVFARLAAETAAQEFAPAELLALLKHPRLRLGRAAGAWRFAIDTLEMAVLRGTRPKAGSEGLRAEFARLRDEITALRRGDATTLHRSDPRVRLAAAALDEAAHLLAQLTAAFLPLESAQTHDLCAMGARHRAVMLALSTDHEGYAAAFEDEDGEALAEAFDDLDAIAAPSGVATTLADYPEVFHTAFSDRIVRRADDPDTRLHIFGPLEARLTHCDRIILGGLVEGVWPPQPPVDPWLSRPMRHQLGLDLPERRIGLSAHDFAQLLGADDVILTYATKVGGAPSVASRFLHRLKAVAGDTQWGAALQRGARYVACAQALDAPDHVTPIARPAPTPPRAARPTRMSVTAIEDWVRDPYSIYARFILKLSPLDPVDMPLSAADRGSAIHGALGEFTQRFSASLPDDVAGMVRDIGKTHFAPLLERPEARALWWPRFLRVAEWFSGWEKTRRVGVAAIDAERDGQLAFALDGGRNFILTARADRIERRRDGGYAIVDYKTGAPPGANEVSLGLSPQLTLEAAILRAGGFPGIAAGASLHELTYVRLSGNTPPGKETVLALTQPGSKDKLSPDDAADEARRKLEIFIRRFEIEATGYSSLDLPKWRNRYGRYDDLARIKEWSATAGVGEDLP